MFTNNKIKVVIVAAFMALGGVIAANAQITDGGAIKFTVDHSFVIKNKTLPAGRYSISALSLPDGSDDILRLQSLDGKESMFFSIIDRVYREPSRRTELVFDQVGGEYILTEIRLEGDQTAVEVEQTKAEKQAVAAAAAVN